GGCGGGGGECEPRVLAALGGIFQEGGDGGAVAGLVVLSSRSVGDICRRHRRCLLWRGAADKIGGGESPARDSRRFCFQARAARAFCQRRFSLIVTPMRRSDSSMKRGPVPALRMRRPVDSENELSSYHSANVMTR